MAPWEGACTNFASLAAVAGAAGIGYASVVERNWFALKEQEVPVLPLAARPLRVLHISDIHLTRAGTGSWPSSGRWPRLSRTWW